MAAVLLGCALLIRDGLLSIAREIRAKPLPQVPQSVNIREVTIKQATLELPRSATNGSNNLRLTIKEATVETPGSATNSTNHVRVTIEDMKVDATLSPPKQK